jgi:hypothetical protein
MPDDYSLPRVTEVEVLGTTLVRVHFNKPVVITDMDGAFVVEDEDGIDVDIDDTDPDYAANFNYSAVNITPNDPLDAGVEYSLTVEGSEVADAAGSSLLKTIKTFEVKDITQLTKATKIEVVGRDEIKVTFDNPVIASGTAEWEFDRDNSASEAVTADSDYVLVFTFEMDEDNVLPVEDGVEITIEDVEDRYGNTVASKTFTVDVEGDSVTTVTLDDAEIMFGEDETVITVEFSREVDESDAEDEDNYVLKDADGDVVDEDVNIVYSNITDIATLTYDDELEAGDYTLEIDGIEDLLGEDVKATTLSVELVDEDAGDLDDANFALADADGDTVIIVEYPEAMDTTTARSVLDANNYAISINEGANYTYLDDLDEDVEIELLSGLDNTVQITIENYAVADVDFLKIRAVNDVLGNLYETYTVEDTDANVDEITTQVDIADADLEIIDDSTLELTIDRALVDIEKADFEIHFINEDDEADDVVPTSVSYENDGLDESVITLKTSIDLSEVTDVTVKTVAVDEIDGTKDYLNLDIQGARTSPEASSGIASEIDQVSIQTTTTLLVEFTKEMAIVRAADFVVEADGEEVDIDDIEVSDFSDYVYVITLDEAISLNDDVEITTIETPQSEDVDGNKLDEVSSAISAEATFKVTGFEYDGLEIIITFNRTVDEDTVDTMAEAEDIFVQGATDTIDLGALGTIDLGAGAIITDDDDAEFDVDVDDDTVTLTLTADALELNVDGYTSTYTPAETITDEDGVYVVIQDSLTAQDFDGVTHVAEE